MLYLDFAASAPIRARALKILEESSRLDFANPSASHKFGREVLKKVESAREFFLKSIKGTSSYNLIFTSSATESNNTIIKGIKLNHGEKVFLCQADHPSLTVPGNNLTIKGIKVISIPLKSDSSIDEERFLELLDDSVRLILLTQINSQSGVINDCFNLSKKIKKMFKNIHIHVDAVQSFSKLNISLEDGSVNSLSVSSHKIGGPKGIAGLFLKKGSEPLPLIEGGGQEFSLRSSTVPAPLILSFKEAIQECLENQDKKLSEAKENYLYLREELKRRIPDISFPFGDLSNSGPFILVLVMPRISSDIILRHLESKNIYISSTSACSSKIKGDNPVFKELNLSSEFYKNVLRISFDERVERKSILKFIESIEKIYLDLRHLI
jgi:cysteine desulfurase